MNKRLKNLCKIEFVVTYACTGKCKHCSEGEHKGCGEFIDPSLAASAVRSIASEYGIETVMAFGGEPLLYPEAVFSIMRAAGEMNIKRRQVITNGYFSNSEEKIRATARELALSGVNDLLLSVDAFHQETIPLDTVRIFAIAAKENGIPIRLQPAWLVSPDDCNPYNEETKRILSALSDLDIPIGEGNVVFYEGNAKKYLSEYFGAVTPDNPYIEDPLDVRCVSFEPNGDVLGGNFYRDEIMDILNAYNP